MKGLLVRVGIDQTPEYGHWNGPVDPRSNDFVYMPKPETDSLLPDFQRSYIETISALENFAEKHDKDVHKEFDFPKDLKEKNMHLDPDFEHLTYGDKHPRNSEMKSMTKDDLIAFYSGLKPIEPCKHRLIYALIGLYIVEGKPLLATEVPRSRWMENAHTRRRKIRERDIVVHAQPEVSGRLRRCIPIGEWRDHAYRVRQDLLAEWGGLRVKDGYIQRSAVPPIFLDSERFYSWFKEQNIPLERRNF